jgi:hypothetical protein
MKSILIFVLAIFVLHTIESTHLRKENSLLSNLLRTEPKSKLTQTTTCGADQIANPDTSSTTACLNCDAAHTHTGSGDTAIYTCLCSAYTYSTKDSKCILTSGCSSHYKSTNPNVCGCQGFNYSSTNSNCTKSKRKSETKVDCATGSYNLKSDNTVCKTTSECGSLYSIPSGETENKCNCEGGFVYTAANTTKCAIPPSR